MDYNRFRFDGRSKCKKNNAAKSLGMKYRFNAEDIKDDYKKLQIEPFSAEQATY